MTPKTNRRRNTDKLEKIPLWQTGLASRTAKWMAKQSGAGGRGGAASSSTVAPALATTTAGDDLRQKIEVGKSTELFYSVRVGSDEQRLPSDLLLVRITNREGRQLAVLERYTHAGGGRWRRETLDLSCFADRIVYLIFFAETGPVLRTAFYLYRVTLKRGNVPKTAPPPRPPP